MSEPIMSRLSDTDTPARALRDEWRKLRDRQMELENEIHRRIKSKYGAEFAISVDAGRNWMLGGNDEV